MRYSSSDRWKQWPCRYSDYLLCERIELNRLFCPRRFFDDLLCDGAEETPEGGQVSPGFGVPREVSAGMIMG